MQGLLISVKHNVDTLLRNVSKTTDITATNSSVQVQLELTFSALRMKLFFEIHVALFSLYESSISV